MYMISKTKGFQRNAIAETSSASGICICCPLFSLYAQYPALNHPPLFVLAAALVSHYQADLDDNFAISYNPSKFTKYKFQTEEVYFYPDEENT